jgi:hypothetical protein
MNSNIQDEEDTMFYHVILEATNRADKSNEYLYEFNIQDLNMIESEIIAPYLQGKKVFFCGHQLECAKINSIEVKESDASIESISGEERRKRPNNTFILTPEKIAKNDRYVRSITRDIFKRTQEKYCASENDALSKDSPSSVIFLSHHSNDKKYGDSVRNLIIGLGLKNDRLIYTSHSLHKIPLDQNIYEYLRKNLEQTVFMIFLWSNDYLNSPACLNEMGAAWLAQKDYTHLFVPDFDFSNPKFRKCAVDTNRIGAILNGDSTCKSNMIEFKNKILRIFNLSIDEQSWTVLLDNFITEIKNIHQETLEKNTIESIDATSPAISTFSQKQEDLLNFLSHLADFRQSNEIISKFIGTIGSFRFISILPALKSLNILSATQSLDGNFVCSLMLGFSNYTEEDIVAISNSIKRGEIV